MEMLKSKHITGILRYFHKDETGSMTFTTTEFTIAFGGPLIIAALLYVIFPGLEGWAFILGYILFVPTILGIQLWLAHKEDKKDEYYRSIQVDRIIEDMYKRGFKFEDYTPEQLDQYADYIVAMHKASHRPIGHPELIPDIPPVTKQELIQALDVQRIIQTAIAQAESVNEDSEQIQDEEDNKSNIVKSETPRPITRKEIRQLLRKEKNK
ncbi:hypothetical protein ACFLYN_04250 [Chloroflexota bacterium]